MASPRSAVNRLDLSLSYSEFSDMLNQRGFIGGRVLPFVTVGANAARFLRVKPETWLTAIETLERAPRGGYQPGNFEWEEDEYTTTEKGAEEPIDDAEIEIYGDIVQIEALASMRALNRVINVFEHAVAQAVFDTNRWTGPLTTAVSTPWTNASSATPLEDLKAAVEAVEEATGGQGPNALIITKRAARNMAFCDEVTDLLKYSGIDNPKDMQLGLNVVREKLQLTKILIADGWKNTAGRGQAATLQRYWDPSMAMVCNISDSPLPDMSDPAPTIGWTPVFSKQAATVLPGAETIEAAIIMEEYRNESLRGGVIRARTNYGIKLQNAEAGHLLTGLEV